MDFIILLLLILLNGIFALSELAIVSSRKAKLQQSAEAGNRGAAVALQLVDDPNRFLSTVQIGITLVGIFAGAFGGSAIASTIADFISNKFPSVVSYADDIGFAVVVGFTTYLSLVIGELVPKRIALSHPEQIASIVARPMQILSRVTAPLVWFLSKSTEVISGLLGVNGDGNHFITDFDVFALMREGIHSGEFDSEEQAMVHGALVLDDKLVRAILTPRTDIVVLDVNDTQSVLREKLGHHQYSAYPITDGDIDNIVGMVRAKDLLRHIVDNEAINICKIMSNPFFVPETVAAKTVLRQFKQRPVHMAVVIGEHGETEGIITLNDIVEEVLGDVDMADPTIIARSDGSWLIDGNLSINDIRKALPDFEVSEDESSDYNTLAGFVLKRLGHIPKDRAKFDWQHYVFEVVDMDGMRVDKVMVTKSGKVSEPDSDLA